MWSLNNIWKPPRYSVTNSRVKFIHWKLSPNRITKQDCKISNSSCNKQGKIQVQNPEEIDLADIHVQWFAGEDLQLPVPQGHHQEDWLPARTRSCNLPKSGPTLSLPLLQTASAALCNHSNQSLKFSTVFQITSTFPSTIAYLLFQALFITLLKKTDWFRQGRLHAGKQSQSYHNEDMSFLTSSKRCCHLPHPDLKNYSSIVPLTRSTHCLLHHSRHNQKKKDVYHLDKSRTEI